MVSPISSLAFVRLSVPDLGRMEEFLNDFGMIKVHRDRRRLYMRGTGPSPYLHVTELGPPGVIGCAYAVDDEGILKDIVQAGDAPGIEDLDGPGGGKRVRMQDPNGCCIELVCERTPVEPLPPRPTVRSADGISRVLGAARVVRVAHTACATPKAKETLDWYRNRFRLIPTDVLFIGSEDNMLGRFDRLDRGEDLVDHHIIFVFKGPVAGLHHISFQVESVDDIFFGFNHLEQGKYDHVRGIGRHALGSQIFDYWMSPFDQMHEHWSSSEKMNAHSKMNHIQIGEGMTHDTGDKPPERFVKQATHYVGWPAN